MIAKVLAWGVHLFTALGLVFAAAIAVLIVRGGDESFRLAFLLMVAATAVDTIDGWLARRFRVSEVLPGFDGRKLDDLIDYQTYTSLPLLLVWRADLLGDASPAWLLVPLMASAYGFSQVQAKTDDHHFLGFPSYWNIVALYLYLFRLPPGWVVAGIFLLALLTFVPARYLYTTHDGGRHLGTNLFGTAWAISLLVILWWWRDAPRLLVVASLSFPAYYMGLSWIGSVHHWRRQRG